MLAQNVLGAAGCLIGAPFHANVVSGVKRGRWPQSFNSCVW